MQNKSEKNKLRDLSVFLCYVLRHKPEDIGLSLDSQGWVSIEDLLAKSNAAGKNIDRQTLDKIVASDSKKRYSITTDGTRIRTAQGHSSDLVKIIRQAKVPPVTLYHGTAIRFLDSILKNGLVPGSRHEVHLCEDHATAVEVGRRHGEPVVLCVDAKIMMFKGFEFYQADNGVWLTDNVPFEFLKLLDAVK